jgi:hypothetical protein
MRGVGRRLFRAPVKRWRNFLNTPMFFSFMKMLQSIAWQQICTVSLTNCKPQRKILCTLQFESSDVISLTLRKFNLCRPQNILPSVFNLCRRPINLQFQVNFYHLSSIILPTLFLHLLHSVLHSSYLHYLSSFFHESNAYSILIQSQKYYFTYCLSSYAVTATCHTPTIKQLWPSHQKIKISATLQRSTSSSTRNNWILKGFDDGI